MDNKYNHLFIELNKMKFHVVSAGEEQGPLLIFLHGFPEFWLSWRKQIDHFVKLGYRVLVPDQRGYNLSEKPDSASAYGMDSLTQDIEELINWSYRKKKNEKIFLVGHDWGAVVAWSLAMKIPERIEKLVIINGPHPAVMQKNLLTNWHQITKSWYIFFFQLPCIPEWFLLKQEAKNLVLGLTKTSRRGTYDKETLKQYQEAWNKTGAVKSMLNWYRAGIRDSFKSPLFSGSKADTKKIQVPTFIIWGKMDKALGTELAEQSLSYCQSGHLEFIEEGTHWVHQEWPEKVNDLIQNFFCK